MQDYKSQAQQTSNEIKNLFKLIFYALDIEKFSGIPEIMPLPDTMFFAAYRLARIYHYNQVDKAGKPYIYHPLKLAAEFAPHNDFQIVAILHDVLEDTSCNIFDLKKAGIPNELISAVAAMTRDRDTDYFQYIRDLCDNKWALAVKLADLYHNTDISRLPDINKWDCKRMVKYKKSLEIMLRYILDEKPICDYVLRISRYNINEQFDDKSQLIAELSKYFKLSEQPIVNKLITFRDSDFDNTGTAKNSYQDITVYAYK